MPHDYLHGQPKNTKLIDVDSRIWLPNARGIREWVGSHMIQKFI